MAHRVSLTMKDARKEQGKRVQISIRQNGLFCALCTCILRAIQIRYPEYATYNKNLYGLLGGAD